MSPSVVDHARVAAGLGAARLEGRWRFQSFKLDKSCARTAAPLDLAFVGFFRFRCNLASREDAGSLASADREPEAIVVFFGKNTKKSTFVGRNTLDARVKKKVLLSRIKNKQQDVISDHVALVPRAPARTR